MVSRRTPSGCLAPPPPACADQKEEELQFAVGAAVADLARSGPLRVPAGKVLEDMRASAKAASRELKEEAVLGEGAGEGGKAAADGGAVVDALDYVLYQVRPGNVSFVYGLLFPAGCLCVRLCACDGFDFGHFSFNVPRPVLVLPVCFSVCCTGKIRCQPARKVHEDDTTYTYLVHIFIFSWMGATAV